MTFSLALARLAAGDKLHMQFVDGRQVWWFESPHQVVPEKIIVQLQAAGDLCELGDSLFGLAGNSQTWDGGGDD